MTLRKRRKVIKGLRELDLEIELPRGPRHTSLYWRLYRSQDLLELFDEMESAKRRLKEVYRSRAREIVKSCKKVY